MKIIKMKNSIKVRKKMKEKNMETWMEEKIWKAQVK
jgi:hypothetical protein